MLPNLIARQVLKHLSDGDKGSTALGGIAGCVLAVNVDFGALAGSDPHKQGVEVAKLVFVGVCFVWGYFIGKKPIAEVRAALEKDAKANPFE